jgi:hypothetical protein
MEFREKLNTFNPDIGQVGFVTSGRVFADPANGDFRPAKNSELIDHGVKFFVPFPLSRVVGEWHFFRHKLDSSLIKGENFYFTSEFTGRERYKNVPRNNLTVKGLSPVSFIKGNLEDWTEGALSFDGKNTYCMLNDTVTSKTICNNVDMTTNDFIIELYFKITKGHKEGVFVSKAGQGGYGYQLSYSNDGRASFIILNDGVSAFSKSTKEKINDGRWHHLLVEVNRKLPGVKLYIDGGLSEGKSWGTMPVPEVSLTNTSDLLVGKSKNGNYFSGAVDFLRISKGSLDEAKTTFEELIKWELDGPFLRDFAGSVPKGKRDAGALESY